jgi:hypothetical protein
MMLPRSLRAAAHSLREPSSAVYLPFTPAPPSPPEAAAVISPRSPQSLLLCRTSMLFHVPPGRCWSASPQAPLCGVCHRSGDPLLSVICPSVLCLCGALGNLSVRERRPCPHFLLPPTGIFNPISSASHSLRTPPAHSRRLHVAMTHRRTAGPPSPPSLPPTGVCDQC